MPARFELPARAVSGIVLGAAAVGALAWGGWLFSVFVAIAAIFALREWHRLVNGGRFAREMLPTSLAIVAALCLVRLNVQPGIAITAILLGAGGASLISALRSGAQR